MDALSNFKFSIYCNVCQISENVKVSNAVVHNAIVKYQNEDILQRTGNIWSTWALAGWGRAPSLRVFIHDTDKVEGGLIVLLSVLFFPLPPLPPKNCSGIITPVLCISGLFFLQWIPLEKFKQVRRKFTYTPIHYSPLFFLFNISWIKPQVSLIFTKILSNFWIRNIRFW